MKIKLTVSIVVGDLKEAIDLAAANKANGYEIVSAEPVEPESGAGAGKARPRSGPGLPKTRKGGKRRGRLPKYCPRCEEDPRNLVGRDAVGQATICRECDTPLCRQKCMPDGDVCNDCRGEGKS